MDDPTLSLLERIQKNPGYTATLPREEFDLFEGLEASGFIFGQIGPDTHDAPDTMVEGVKLTATGRQHLWELRQRRQDSSIGVHGSAVTNPMQSSQPAAQGRSDLFPITAPEATYALLDLIWDHYKPKGEWPTTWHVHRQLGKSQVMAARKSLNGNHLIENPSDRGQVYQLQISGVLLTQHGKRLESLLVSYVDFLRERYLTAPDKRDVASVDVKSSLGFSDEDIRVLGQLISICGFFGTGSQSAAEWLASVPLEIEDCLPGMSSRDFLRQQIAKRVLPLAIDYQERQRQVMMGSLNVPFDDDKDSASPEIDADNADTAFIEPGLRGPPRLADSHFGNDAVAKEDTLSRRRLAQVLATFLRDKRTRRPLTLSVEGPWGSGKTTFMRLLEEELAQGPRKIRTIWFNPWRHQTQEELWAAFALQVTEAITSGLDWKSRWRNWRKLHATLFNWKEGWRDVVALLLRFPLWIVTFVAGFVLLARGLVDVKDKEFLEAFMWGVPGLVTIVLAALIAWRKTDELLGSPFEIDLKRHLAKPNYEEKASFLAQFQAHFRNFCRIYIPTDESYVICVDDLDRCDAAKAAELMQAINLMLSDEAPFIYVLGMDRAKVAAGIAVKSRELLPFIYARELAATAAGAQEDALRTRGLEYGYEFIEKFIQLPFRLPPSEPQEVRSFIRGRLTLRQEPILPPATPSADPTGGTTTPASTIIGPQAPLIAPPPLTGAPDTPISDPDESHLEAPLLFATRILNGNPRRIAQLINLVRLQRLIAPELGVIVGDGQLAKWTAIALRWPLFVLDLSQETGLLVQLLATNEPANPSTRYVHWRGIAEFVNFVRLVEPTGDDPDEYRLNSPEVIEALLRLGVTVPLVDDSKALARAIANRLERG